MHSDKETLNPTSGNSLVIYWQSGNHTRRQEGSRQVRQADSTFYINLQQTDVGSASPSSKPLTQTKHNDWASNQTCFLGGQEDNAGRRWCTSLHFLIPTNHLQHCYQEDISEASKGHVLSCVMCSFADHRFTLGSCIIDEAFCSSPSPLILGNWSHVHSAVEWHEEAGNCEVRGTMKTSLASKFGIQAGRPQYIQYPLQWSSSSFSFQ